MTDEIDTSAPRRGGRVMWRCAVVSAASAGVCTVLTIFLMQDLYRTISYEAGVAGILCRAHGLDAVYLDADTWEAREIACIDLSGAVPEKDLWEQHKSRITGSTVSEETGVAK